MELDPLAVRCMDTPVFQRLRELKQLGSSYFVFGGASHNRFEHSVGVYHLSKTMVDRFSISQPELGITDDERTSVALAGLLHDLGHGPFSHVFDAEFIPRARPGASWTHEQMSIDLIDVMLEQGELADELSPDVVASVKGMIMGGKLPKGYSAKGTRDASAMEPMDATMDRRDAAAASGGGGPPSIFQKAASSSSSSSSAAAVAGSGTGAGSGLPYAIPSPGREFLFEVVANARNNIDVDKFDYLARDSRCVGLKSTFDFSRLVRSARVVEGQICFPFKEAMTIYNLFFNRYLLFKQIYTHRASKAIEFMLTDILLEADAAWQGRISGAIDNPLEYAKLTDGILREIENSTDSSLAKARGLVSDLRRRKLYRFVDQWLVPTESTKAIPKPTAQDIVGLNPRPDVPLRAEDLVVQDFKVHFGNKDKDPLQLTGFFRPSRPDTLCAHDPSKFSHCITPTFQERILRLYCRRPEREFVRAAGEAFRRWVKRVSPDASNTPDHSSRIFSPARSTGGRSKGGGSAMEEDEEEGGGGEGIGAGGLGLGIGSRAGDRRMTLSQQNVMFGEGDLVPDEASASQLQLPAEERSGGRTGGRSRASAAVAGAGALSGSKRGRGSSGASGAGSDGDESDEDDEQDSRRSRSAAPLSQIPGGDDAGAVAASSSSSSGPTGAGEGASKQRPPAGPATCGVGASSKRRRTSSGSAGGRGKGKAKRGPGNKDGSNPWTMSASQTSSGSGSAPGSGK